MQVSYSFSLVEMEVLDFLIYLTDYSIGLSYLASSAWVRSMRLDLIVLYVQCACMLYYRNMVR